MKTKIVVLLLVLIIAVFGISSIAAASTTTYDTGYLGNFHFIDAWEGGQTYTIEVPGLTIGDSIVQVTLRYKYYNLGAGMTYRMHAYRGNWYLTGPTSTLISNIILGTDWSPYETYNVNSIGANKLGFEWFAPHQGLDVEVTNVKYKRYSVDNVSLSVDPNTGYVNVAIANSTPTTNYKYYIQNITTGKSFDGYEGINADNSVTPGKAFTYYVRAGFAEYAVNNPVISTQTIFVPMDSQLTDKVNTIISNTSNPYGNTIDAVRDSAGTALSEARQAKTSAQNASTYASQANTNAINAYNTAQTVSIKIDTLSSAITNIQNNMGTDTTSPIVNLSTLSGARATSGNSIRAFLNVSDNISTTCLYSINNGDYHVLPDDGIIDLPVTKPGANQIYIKVKDEAGNTNSVLINIRKL
jgi:hypothetical protein